jgi:tRNA pseudouridine synthase 10
MESNHLSDDIKNALSALNQEALKAHKLCDNCLGRLLARVGKAEGNHVRGRIMREAVGGDRAPSAEECELCRGLTSKVDLFSGLALEAFGPWEHGNFLIGTKVALEVQAKEEAIWVETRTEHSEPIKAELNREIGKLVERRSGKPVEFGKPDVIAIVDTTYESVEIQVSPLYLYGRYTKHTRGIPQTRWPCRQCRGKGCERCGGTGKMYQDSVEELVGRVALRHAKGSDHRFHGMGREDIDALMLGNGRPFVLEVKEPMVRTLDHAKLEQEINASTRLIQVAGIRQSDNEEVVRIKSARPDKMYRVRVGLDTPVEEEKIKEVVACLGGKRISQRTPKRVSHRRADRKRERSVRAIDYELASPTDITFQITTEAGTYIKELVHGDEGGTEPSIASTLGVVCDVKTLDVLEIMDIE